MINHSMDLLRSRHEAGDARAGAAGAPPAQ
jgi:hypothetical protein